MAHQRFEFPPARRSLMSWRAQQCDAPSLSQMRSVFCSSDSTKSSSQHEVWIRPRRLLGPTLDSDCCGGDGGPVDASLSFAQSGPNGSQSDTGHGASGEHFCTEMVTSSTKSQGASPFFEQEGLRRWACRCTPVPSEQSHWFVPSKHSVDMSRSVSTCPIKHTLVQCSVPLLVAALFWQEFIGG